MAAFGRLPTSVSALLLRDQDLANGLSIEAAKRSGVLRTVQRNDAANAVGVARVWNSVHLVNWPAFQEANASVVLRLPDVASTGRNAQALGQALVRLKRKKIN